MQPLHIVSPDHAPPPLDMMNKWVGDAVSFCLKQGLHSQKDVRNQLMGSVPYGIDNTFASKLEYAERTAIERLSEARANTLQTATAMNVQDVVERKKRGRPRKVRPEKQIAPSPEMPATTEEVGESRVEMTEDTSDKNVHVSAELEWGGAEEITEEIILPDIDTVTSAHSPATAPDTLSPAKEDIPDKLKAETALEEPEEDATTIHDHLESDQDDDDTAAVELGYFDKGEDAKEPIDEEALMEKLADRLAEQGDEEEVLFDPDMIAFDELWHTALGRVGPDTIELDTEHLEPIDEKIEWELAHNPTNAKPGSLEKVLVLEARYKHGMSLWHEEDAVDHRQEGQRSDDEVEYYYD